MYKIEIPRQIGQMIKSKRLEKGFTQEQLASFANTSRSLVYRLEKGATNGISLNKLFDILKVLDLELAIIDSNNTPKSIQKITNSTDAQSNHAKTRNELLSPAPDHKTTIKKDSSRNTPAQREKELKAIQNIRSLNIHKSLKG